MNCPKCNQGTTIIASDSRQEWFAEEYECNSCYYKFIRKVTYKPQSKLIDTDEIIREGYN